MVMQAEDGEGSKSRRRGERRRQRSQCVRATRVSVSGARLADLRDEFERTYVGHVCELENARTPA